MTKIIELRNINLKRLLLEKIEGKIIILNLKRRYYNCYCYYKYLNSKEKLYIFN